MKRTPAHRAFAAWCAAIDPATIDAAWDRCNDSTKAAWQRVADALSAPAQTTTDTFPTAVAALQWIMEQGFIPSTPGSRAIQANTGLIAHHGYTRPGQGWQTASCYGARKLPYEESCNAIPPYIDIVRDYGERQAKYAQRVLTNPPAEYKVAKNLPNVRVPHLPEHFEVHALPANFQPERALAGTYGYYDKAYKYAMHFRSDVRKAETQAKNAADEVAHMEQRYKDWKPKT